jgi:chorismate mutase/prephenate dehydratase
VPQASIEATFLAVEHGRVDYGVVPIENSTVGVVPETLDMFALTNVKICAETYVSIQHHLLSHAKSLADVKRLYAGPQPANQCRQWVKEHLPHAEILEVMPTSRAAQLAKEDPESAAIANLLTSELTGLPILAERIEDHAQNETRFLVVGFNEPAKTGRDKTSVIFNLRNRPGELYRALGIFDREGVNLSMIESRPAPRAAFEYLFYCDFDGHRLDPNIERTMEALKLHALETIWLGSYPTALSRV